MRPIPLIALLLAAGCGHGRGGASTVPAYSFNFPLRRASPTPLVATAAFPNLAFDRPVFLTHAPDGTDRLFVVEQSGRILVFANDAAAVNARVFLDITARVTASGGEEGLLGLAFAPDYATTGFFYAYYTTASPHQSVLASYRVTNDPDVADPASESVLLSVAQPFGNHNAGMLAFGPDGMLYVALGDGGSGGDPFGHGQDRTTLLGSLLRIDPRGGSPYAIPADNPFVGEGGGVREEIWAYGLRNPWRFSFDRQTGELWLGDVGQGSREEIDVIVRGGNYGWKVYEGNLPYENPQGRPPSDFVAPVLDYFRQDGASVTGGYVYRGARLAELRGAYLYGDYVSGRIWAAVRQGQAVSITEVANIGRLTSFGEDRDGEVLAVSHDGRIFRFERADRSVAAFPSRLSETGLFRDLATLTPVAGLVEYEVNSPLWSDAADKRRWLASPHGAIQFREDEPWSLPVGVVLVKHFELEMTVGDPASRRRLETRVILHEEGGFAGYTYRWNDAQTDADLLADRLDVTYTITDPAASGGQRQQTWTYPSRTDCLQCHTLAAGPILGTRTAQLHRLIGGEEQLDRLLRLRVLHGTTPGASHARYPDPADAAHSDAERARSYLAVNCANCHSAGGPAPTAFDLGFGVSQSSMGVVDVRPTRGDLGLPDAWLVRRGQKEASVLWERLRRLDATRMPPLASHLVDPLAVDVIGRWVDGL